MQTEYLKGVHEYLDTGEDFETWLNTSRNNDEYLRGVHDLIGPDKEYEEWKKNSFGGQITHNKTDNIIEEKNPPFIIDKDPNNALEFYSYPDSDDVYYKDSGGNEILYEGEVFDGPGDDPIGLGADRYADIPDFDPKRAELDIDQDAIFGDMFTSRHIVGPDGTKISIN